MTEEHAVTCEVCGWSFVPENSIEEAKEYAMTEYGLKVDKDFATVCGRCSSRLEAWLHTPEGQEVLRKYNEKHNA